MKLRNFRQEKGFGTKLRTFNKSMHDLNELVKVIICVDWKEFINIKNNKTYFKLGEVINATNSSCGNKMFLYSDGKDFYVRNIDEFNIKFKSE